MNRNRFDECEDTCAELHLHKENLEHAKSVTPDLDTLFTLAEFFKMFGDSTRIRILFALFDTELCVCDIAELLGMGQSAISHQLRLLRSAHLVRVRRDGKSSFYSLDDEHVQKICALGLSHVQEESK